MLPLQHKIATSPLRSSVLLQTAGPQTCLSILLHNVSLAESWHTCERPWAVIGIEIKTMLTTMPGGDAIFIGSYLPCPKQNRYDMTLATRIVRSLMLSEEVVAPTSIPKEPLSVDNVLSGLLCTIWAYVATITHLAELLLSAEVWIGYALLNQPVSILLVELLSLRLPVRPIVTSHVRPCIDIGHQTRPIRGSQCKASTSLLFQYGMLACQMEPWVPTTNGNILKPCTCRGHGDRPGPAWQCQVLM